MTAGYVHAPRSTVPVRRHVVLTTENVCANFRNKYWQISTRSSLFGFCRLVLSRISSLCCCLDRCCDGAFWQVDDLNRIVALTKNKLDEFYGFGKRPHVRNLVLGRIYQDYSSLFCRNEYEVSRINSGTVK